MLRANVGLSRKITRDYNSTGYSVSLDGEIPFPVDDPQAVTEKIKELFSLAQEALALEIDRDQGEDAIGRRDEERPSAPNPHAKTNSNGNGKPAPSNGNPQTRPAYAPANRSRADTRSCRLATATQLRQLLHLPLVRTHTSTRSAYKARGLDPFANQPAVHRVDRLPSTRIVLLESTRTFVAFRSTPPSQTPKPATPRKSGNSSARSWIAGPALQSARTSCRKNASYASRLTKSRRSRSINA